MRLFAAIRPSIAAHDHLDSALAPFRATAGTDLRWTDPDNWHLTLAFYGDRPEGELDDITAFIGAVAERHRAYELCLRGAGSFSHNTLWIGVGGETTALEKLMSECSLGDDPDPTRIRRRAHVTVARLSASARKEHSEFRRKKRSGTRRSHFERPPLPLADYVRALSVYSGPGFRAESIELLCSTLGAGRGGGSRYDLLARVPFGAAP